MWKAFPCLFLFISFKQTFAADKVVSLAEYAAKKAAQTAKAAPSISSATALSPELLALIEANPKMAAVLADPITSNVVVRVLGAGSKSEPAANVLMDAYFRASVRLSDIQKTVSKGILNGRENLIARLGAEARVADLKVVVNELSKVVPYLPRRVSSTADKLAVGVGIVGVVAVGASLKGVLCPSDMWPGDCSYLDPKPESPSSALDIPIGLRKDPLVMGNVDLMQFRQASGLENPPKKESDYPNSIPPQTINGQLVIGSDEVDHGQGYP